jgi:hypothetical protein
MRTEELLVSCLGWKKEQKREIVAAGEKWRGVKRR